MLVNMKYVLDKANKEKYAVGAFNFNNMEQLKAIVDAAKDLKSPIIVSTTQGAIDYAGEKMLYNMVKTFDDLEIPIVLHLDHGKDFEYVLRCIRAGWTSVMIDASMYEFEENIKRTKRVVDIAKILNVSVEAELGHVTGEEDGIIQRSKLYTDPKKAKEFVDKTGIDFLAVAIGTSHGAYKYEGELELDIKRLKEIKKIIPIPLVLHGASGIDQKLVKIATIYGAKLKGAKGIEDEQIKLAVKNGINKVNIDSDNRIAFMTGVRETLAKDSEVFDPRKILKSSYQYMYDLTKSKIKLLGSENKV